MPEASPSPVGALLELEAAARSAERAGALYRLIVNDTHRVVAYEQAALLVPRRSGRWHVVALSNVSEVDRSAPYVQWVEGIARQLELVNAPAGGRAIQSTDLTGALLDDWRALAPSALRMVPLRDAVDGQQGLLVLARAEPWRERDETVLAHLSMTFGHALSLWRARRGVRIDWGVLARRWVTLLTSVLLVGLMFLPVRMSALAPAEVIARDPAVVTSPLDGAIESVEVRSNALVAAGERVVQLDTTELRNAARVARRELAVAEAELHEGQQGALRDSEQRARLERLRTQVELQSAKLAYADERLADTSIRAPQAGVAIVDDPGQMEGRPVRAGEELLRIADPESIQLEIMLPVVDALVLDPGADVRLFLDTQPLQPIAARVVRGSYRPETTATGSVAYRVIAMFDEDPALRIGLRGTARLKGEQTTLFYYLFRRPITAARQWLGW